MNRNWIADKCELAADLFGDARIYGSAVAGAYLAFKKGTPSWKFGIAVGALLATDAIDGKIARFGAKIAGRETRPEGGIKDHDSDHKTFRNLAAGMAINAFRNRHIGYGAMTLGSLAVNVTRDFIVEGHREQAKRFNDIYQVPDEHRIRTDSVKSGKRKTEVQFSALTWGCTPIVTHPIGQVVVSSALVTGATMSVTSGIEAVRSIQNQAGFLIETGHLNPPV